MKLRTKFLLLVPLKNRLLSHFLVLSLMLLPYFPIILVINLHDCKNIQVSSYEFLNGNGFIHGAASEEVLLLFCILKYENVLNVIAGFRQFIYREERVTVNVIFNDFKDLEQ